MTTKQTTLQQDLGSLAADLVTAGNHEGAALVTAAVNAMAAPADMPASDAPVFDVMGLETIPFPTLKSNKEKP